MQIDPVAVVVGALAGASLVAHVLAFALIFRQKREMARLGGEGRKIRRDMNWGFRDLAHHMTNARATVERDQRSG